MSAVHQLAALLPPALAAALAGASPPAFPTAAREVAAALEDAPRSFELLGALTSVDCSPCAKDAAEAAAARARGTAAYARGAYNEAAESFGAALRLCAPGRDAATLHANRAAALLRAGHVIPALRDCDAALLLDPAHEKAAVRRTALRAAVARDPPPATSGAAAEAYALALAALATPQPPPPRQQALPVLPPHAELPYAAPGVLCAPEPGAGRGLRTASPRVRGDVALAEPPYAAAVHKAARTSRCHACFVRLPPDAHPCAACALARYCSAACAAADAAGHHAHECGGAAWPAALPTDAVLAARVAVRCARELAMQGSSDATAERGPEAAGGAHAVAALAYNWAELPGEERTERVLMAVVLARCLHASPAMQRNAATPMPDAVALLQALLALRCNSFAVTDDWAPACWAGASRDQAVYCTGSLLNHACAPSAAASFAAGGALVVRCTAALGAGAPLTLSYGPQAGEAPAPHRRRLLRASHAFRCACTACEAAATSAPEAELHGLRCFATRGCGGALPCPLKPGASAAAALQAAPPPACPACGVAPAGADYAAAAKSAAAALMTIKKLRDGAGVGPHHVPQLAQLVAHVRSSAHAHSRAVAEAEDAVAEALSAAGDAEGAAAAASRALLVLRRHYPAGSLPLAHEAAKMAQLLAVAGGCTTADEVAALAQEACESFRAHYGDDYPRILELAPLARGV